VTTGRGDEDAARVGDPTELLRRLIRFDTTNPPGRERACVEWVEGLLSDAGLETRFVARDPGRPNLVARLEGDGRAPPLLLYGHVDVVPAEPDAWRHPPFEGVLEVGWVWGRGALDMKGGVAMILSAVLRAARAARDRGRRPAGDVLVAVLADEEGGGDHGARFLVEEHADLFAGVRWAIGEFGGFPLRLGGATFHPVQVAEKGVCWLEATVRGPGGHGSFPRRGGTMARLGRLLETLDAWEGIHRAGPAVRRMIEGMADSVDPPLDGPLRLLLDPGREKEALAGLGPEAILLEGVLHDTANPTVVRAGSKTNVVPGEARVRIDGRTLPGSGPDELVAALRVALSEAGLGEVELDVIRADAGAPASGEPDLALFPLLADLLREADPEARPVPFVLLGGTDGRFFSRIGIQTYGWLPLVLPADFDFLSTVHGPDERVPVAGLEFGARALRRLLEEYGEEEVGE